MTGVIILCRYNSRRLPGKILKVINNKPILKYIHERLELIKSEVKIVVATSELKSDDIIEQFCKLNSIECFRGELHNVSKRFLDCAEHFNLNTAIRINGDNLFTDSNLIDEMLNYYNENTLNFLSNVKGRTWPKGISIEIVNTKFYKSNIIYFNEKDKEHVMTFFYRNKKQNVKFLKNKHKTNTKINLSIDTLNDFEFAKSIISLMEKNHTEYNFKDIINFGEKLAMKNSFVGKNGPILIAEIGGNHEGNFDYAKKLLKDAISTDVDVIKFQIYFPETLVNKKVDKNRYNHFKKFTLSKNQHIELAKICRNSGKNI